MSKQRKKRSMIFKKGCSVSEKNVIINNYIFLAQIICKTQFIDSKINPWKPTDLLHSEVKLAIAARDFNRNKPWFPKGGGLYFALQGSCTMA